MNEHNSTIKNQYVSNSKPIPAATVLLIRNGKSGLEVFMVVRHHQIDFASGALVFPGGKVSAEDYDDELKKLCNSNDQEDLPYVMAAIRETFEESGFLLAKENDIQRNVSNERLTELGHYREQLHNDEITLAEFLKTEHLIADSAAMIPFAHWVTPEIVPKRFDTMFYLVAVPEGQFGEHDGTESVDSCWINPEQAIKENEAGKRTLVFATRMNLMKLSQYDCVEDAIGKTKKDNIRTVQPWVEDRKKRQVLCIPKDAGYPVTEAFLETELNRTR